MVFVTRNIDPEELRGTLALMTVGLNGVDLQGLIDRERILIEHIAIDPTEVAEVGDYDLEALFLRLEFAVDQIGAKRIVLDTIESLFSAFQNPAVLRAEIRRLFDWLKQKGLTAVITGERGDGTLTRQGLEEYVSDCVILLDHRVENQISTRRLRIVKYRGTAHGTNEYPFLIDEDGFSATTAGLGLTSAALLWAAGAGVLGALASIIFSRADSESVFTSPFLRDSSMARPSVP